MPTIFIRTIIIYIVLIGTMRLMGKRQVGELQLSELVITFMLSELATIPISDGNLQLVNAIVPILLLLSIEVIFSFIAMKLPVFRKIMYGKPSILIHRGKLDQQELLHQRVELSELICAIRQSGVADISDVQYAILEENGKISVFPKAQISPATPEQLKIDIEDSGIAHMLIIDKKILRSNLAPCGWDEARLQHELDKQKCSLEDVFLLSVTDTGSVTLIKKEEK